MPTETPLDAAHWAMQADPEDLAARLRFHERVLDAELFVLLEAEPESGPESGHESGPESGREGETLRPRVLPLEDGPVVLAFDRDDRLASFLDAPAPYAALSGQRLAALLAGRGIGVLLNPEVAPSASLLTAETVDWLAAGEAASEIAATRVREIGPPAGASPALLAALGTKLAAMAGTLSSAWLATLRFSDGTARLALAIEGAPAAAEAMMADAIAETVRFSASGDEGLDVTFVAAGTPARAAFDRVGLRFELPPPAAPPLPREGDPDRPPILR